MDSWLLFDRQNQVQPVDETGGAVIGEGSQQVDYGAAVIGEAAILPPEEVAPPEPTEGKQTPDESNSPPPPEPPPEDTRINVNKAEPEALEALPGIGPKTVARILVARDQSIFISNDDLKQRVSSAINWEELNLRFA